MNLPNEIILIIFQYLSGRDLIRCSSVSHLWYDLTCDDNLWKKFILSPCQILNYHPKNFKPMNYKKIYKKINRKKTILVESDSISGVLGLGMSYFLITKYIYCWDLHNSISHLVFGSRYEPIIYIQKGRSLYKIPNNNQIIKLEHHTKVICHEEQYNINQYIDRHNYTIQNL